MSLAQVFEPPAGARYRILEYLAETAGLTPQMRSANDIFHWQTTLVVTDANAVEQKLRATNQRLISPTAVDLGQKKEEPLVGDPGGHAMALIEAQVLTTARKEWTYVGCPLVLSAGRE
jgi:hypothetical protein